jgi:hypothetical protein
MSNEELKYLFNTYLKRDYNASEITVHGHKNYQSFEEEIKKCNEYFNLKTNAKIAILLTGHIRHANIIDTIKKICSGYDYDIFIHSWDNYGYKGKETDLNDRVVKEEIENYITTIPNVKSYLIENNKSIIDKMSSDCIYFNYSSPEPFIKSQLYSINKCYQLFESYSKETGEHYDIVFKFRFDSILTDFKIDTELITTINTNQIIFVPNSDCGHTHPDTEGSSGCWVCNNMFYKHNLRKVHFFEHTNVICDLFAYGSEKSMKTYCDLYNHYDSLNKSFESDNLKQLNENNNINFNKINNVYQLELTDKGHIDSVYYFKCSYPERLLQIHLKNYMLIRSEKIKVKFIR